MGTIDTTGMRRISWIRILDDGTTLRAEAIGIGHRLPTVRPIPVALAAALAASGLPMVRTPRTTKGTSGTT